LTSEIELASGALERLLQWPSGSLLSERGGILLLGALINQAASLLSAKELFKLTRIVYRHQPDESSFQTAFTATMLFAVSPATVFFCAM
jgi:hypothetical protein